MKPLVTIIFASLIAHSSFSQVISMPDTSRKQGNNKIFTSVEQVPEFPGGIGGFSNYISKSLQYPEVARLVGINGRVIVSFVVDQDGKTTDVRPVSCVGAGCEAEAVRVIETSPKWKPGIQDGTPVRVQYTVPISFSLGTEKGKAYIDNLRQSNYGFVFNIKGTLYTIDEAEKILGHSFMSDKIEHVDVFYNYEKIPKFDMPDKKEVYLLIFKST